MFVASRRARRKTTVISLCQYRSIISVLRDLIEYENNWRAVTTRNRIMQHCVQSGLWAKKSSGPAPPKETARASHTSRGLAIFKHTFGLCARLRAPQQRLLEPSSNPAQRHCPCTESFKGAARTDAVCLHASRTSCDGRSWLFSNNSFTEL